MVYSGINEWFLKNCYTYIQLVSFLLDCIPHCLMRSNLKRKVENLQNCYFQIFLQIQNIPGFPSNVVGYITDRPRSIVSIISVFKTELKLENILF